MDSLLTDAEMSQLASVFPEGFTGRVGKMIRDAQDTKTRKVIREGLESMVRGLGYVIIRDKAWQEFWGE